jgi:hypothetical protein
MFIMNRLLLLFVYMGLALSSSFTAQAHFRHGHRRVYVTEHMVPVRTVKKVTYIERPSYPVMSHYYVTPRVYCVDPRPQFGFGFDSRRGFGFNFGFGL